MTKYNHCHSYCFIGTWYEFSNSSSMSHSFTDVSLQSIPAFLSERMPRFLTSFVLVGFLWFVCWWVSVYRVTNAFPRVRNVFECVWGHFQWWADRVWFVEVYPMCTFISGAALRCAVRFARTKRYTCGEPATNASKQRVGTNKFRRRWGTFAEHTQEFWKCKGFGWWFGYFCRLQEWARWPRRGQLRRRLCAGNLLVIVY